VQTGSQALAVTRLIESCGGQLVAISVMVDQLDSAMRSQLPSVHSIVSFAHLPPYDE
jgi:adenine/guanine phosphoribosyltransferase-like PRPP-binding protein